MSEIVYYVYNMNIYKVHNEMVYTISDTNCISEIFWSYSYRDYEKKYPRLTREILLSDHKFLDQYYKTYIKDFLEPI